MQSILEKLKTSWEAEGVLYQTGVDPHNIEAFESNLGFFLPTEFKLYLQFINGMEEGEADNSLFCFWGLDLIITESKSFKKNGSNRYFLSFADRIVIDSVYMIEVFKEPSFQGQVAIDKNGPHIICNGFNTFLYDYLHNLDDALPEWESSSLKKNKESPFTLLNTIFPTPTFLRSKNLLTPTF